jgi:hypothetical protein
MQKTTLLAAVAVTHQQTITTRASHRGGQDQHQHGLVARLAEHLFPNGFCLHSRGIIASIVGGGDRLLLGRVKTERRIFMPMEPKPAARRGGTRASEKEEEFVLVRCAQRRCVGSREETQTGTVSGGARTLHAKQGRHGMDHGWTGRCRRGRWVISSVEREGKPRQLDKWSNAALYRFVPPPVRVPSLHPAPLRSDGQETDELLHGRRTVAPRLHLFCTNERASLAST